MSIKPLTAVAVVCALFAGNVSEAEGLDAKGWFEKGNQLMSENRLEEATESFRKSIETNPLSPAAHYNLGLAYKKMRLLEKAARAFEETVRLEPSHLDARFSLGNVYSYLERWQEAIGQLNIIVHRRRDDAEAHGNLGWAYYNYKKGPPFKLLPILNLKKALRLFEQRGMSAAAVATRGMLKIAEARLDYPVLE